MNLGMVVPEAETIARSKPLDVSFGPYLRAIARTSMDSILIPVKDRAGRLHYRSAAFRHETRRPTLTKKLLASIRKLSSRVILEIRAFDDSGLAGDPQICVHEFVESTLVTKADRACPTSEAYLHKLAKIAQEVCNYFEPEGIHFPYFRYQNSNQCYCERCVLAFSSISGVRVESGEQLALIVSSNADVFSRWISWRASALSGALSFLREQVPPDVEVSIEIDIDARRNYLTGLRLEEGLDVYDLANHVDEMFLHVQPGGWPNHTDLTEETVQLLRLMVGDLRRASVRPTLFFWFLRAAPDLRRALRILMRCGADSAFFFDTRPGRFGSWWAGCREILQ